MSLAQERPTFARELVDDVLNELTVTDIVFNDLRYTQPLAVELLRRLRQRAEPGARVLLIAPNALLPQVAVGLGYEVEIWQVPAGTLTQDLEARVVRTAALDELAATASPATGYDVIVLPYVLDSISISPSLALAHLRQWLRPGGCLIVAHRRAGALRHRLRALLGKPMLEDDQLRQPVVSFSWPDLPPRRVFGDAELSAWSRHAGFRVEDPRSIMDRHATIPTSMTLTEWGLAQAAHAMKLASPPLRDCTVATLTPHPVALGPAPEDALRSQPFVTVIVACNTGSSEAVLTDLRAQTYPSTRFEIILCEHPSGPSAANRAIDQAAGQIVALTDDQCRIPPGWIEAGVAGMTGWTAAVTGDVLDHSETSRRFFLNLPGRRPSVREEPLYLAANSFYRTDAVRQAGGFDVAFESGQAPGWGWDNQLAYRLASLGYRLGFDEAVYVTRTFPAPRGFEWIADEYRRASEIPIAIRRSPGLSAGFLKGNLFLSPRSLFFDLLVAGVALSAITRRRRYLGLALPWLATTSKYFDAWPPRIWRKSVGTMAEMTARQGIWLVGLIAGSIRARRVVL